MFHDVRLAELPGALAVRRGILDPATHRLAAVLTDRLTHRGEESECGIVAQMDARGERGLDDPFEEAIDEALSSLPADIRAAISNVAIVVEEEPPYGQLLGLYSGVPMQKGWTFSGTMRLPAKVSIFRGPITRLAAGDADRLRHEVRHVVLHELRHYFGIE